MFERSEWKELEGKTINSPETMIEAIKKAGIIPFFKAGIPGWSIEEQTAPGFWFWEEEDNLGPWDWKIDAVQTGEIAYGKFLGGKAAFATVEYYRELMNWRRSLPKYRAAIEEGKRNYMQLSAGEKVMSTLGPVVLEAIRENGTMEMKELRQICIEKVGARIPGTQLDIKKNIMDSVMAWLQMGTWTVIGDFTRVYRGPNLTYSGWQRTSNTTPEALFGIEWRDAAGEEKVEGAPGASAAGKSAGLTGAGKAATAGSGGAKRPFWAGFIEPEEEMPQILRSPEESRELLISHVEGLYPGAKRKILEKII